MSEHLQNLVNKKPKLRQTSEMVDKFFKFVTWSFRRIKINFTKGSSTFLSTTYMILFYCQINDQQHKV